MLFSYPDDLMQEGQSTGAELIAQHSLIALKRPLHFIGFAVWRTQANGAALQHVRSDVIGGIRHRSPVFWHTSIAEHSYGNRISRPYVLVALQLTAELLRG